MEMCTNLKFNFKFVQLIVLLLIINDLSNSLARKMMSIDYPSIPCQIFANRFVVASNFCE